MEADLEALLRAAEAQGLAPGALARLRTYMERRLEAFRRLVRQHVEREPIRGPRRAAPSTPHARPGHRGTAIVASADR